MESRKIKPFPWMCPKCRAKTIVPVRRDYKTSAVLDDEIYDLVVPAFDVPTCAKCGQAIVISELCERITCELRRAAGILAPEQIQAQRENLGLTQAELAARLRVSEAELARWESGMQLQSKAVDLLLRLYLGSAEVRQACGTATAELMGSAT
jgi:putative zinc finger/helix-turn-helix YgiT family protein